MAEHKIKLEIPDCISKPIEEGLTPVTKSLGSSIGNTISVAWELAFGGLDSKLEKVKYKRQKGVESFREELDSKINKIPLGNVIEAEMHIVGPTLEASKYYFEKEDLRNMFSSLIASSVNTNLVDKVHPSFVEIIKQLSSLDASIIKTFPKNKSLPLCEYSLVIDDDNSSTIATNVFIENSNINNFTWDIQEKNSSSLTNLYRLGLIEISYDRKIYTYDYDIFTKTPIYDNIKDSVSKKLLKAPDLNNVYFNSTKIEPGLVKLTQLGKDFIDICLSDNI